MLNEHELEFHYREYRKEPLSEAEIRSLLGRLGIEPSALLRRRDKAAVQLGLTGDESASKLIALMANHPTLIQRPIGVLGDRAVLGRPPERLLDLVDLQA